MAFCRIMPAVVAVGAIALQAQSTPGLPPQASPAHYSAMAQTAKAAYAASLLSNDHVKHLFPVDLSKTYFVFEVACYPGQDGTLDIDPEDFSVKTGTNSVFVHPVDAVTIASVLQQKNQPRRASRNGTNTDIVVGSTVGYESGTDPYTGRRSHGVYTDSTVGVGVGLGGSPQPPPPPATSPDEMRMLETQLARKSLPSGHFIAAVAGYLFFPANEMKKPSSNLYKLNYLGDTTGKVEIAVPAKTR